MDRRITNAALDLATEMRNLALTVYEHDKLMHDMLMTCACWIENHVFGGINNEQD